VSLTAQNQGVTRVSTLLDHLTPNVLFECIEIAGLLV